MHDPDQNSTDFTKCLKFVAKDWKKHHTPNTQDSRLTVAFGSLGGRADQAFAQIHQLYMAASDTELHCGQLYLFTPAGVVFVLEKGENIIKTPVGPGEFSENVGIIPICSPAVISTKGLEWDVEDWHTSFETQMSTSNHIKAKEVTVTTSERVLFTLEFAKDS